MQEARIEPRLSAGRLLGVTFGAAIVATVVVFGAVLPAEFGKDPTGFGRLSGLSRLAAPQGQVAPRPSAAAAGVGLTRFEVGPPHNDTLDISLAAADTDPAGAELEYKVAMQAGAALVYTWTVEGLSNAAEFYYDLHSEGEGTPEPRVVEYRQATGSASSGSLTAPFDGIHGWYFQNQSDRPVVVHLRISGFYELIPPGRPGNLAGVMPGTRK